MINPGSATITSLVPVLAGAAIGAGVERATLAAGLAPRSKEPDGVGLPANGVVDRPEVAVAVGDEGPRCIDEAGLAGRMGLWMTRDERGPAIRGTGYARPVREALRVEWGHGFPSSESRGAMRVPGG